MESAPVFGTVHCFVSYTHTWIQRNKNIKRRGQVLLNQNCLLESIIWHHLVLLAIGSIPNVCYEFTTIWPTLTVVMKLSVSGFPHLRHIHHPVRAYYNQCPSIRMHVTGEWLNRHAWNLMPLSFNQVLFVNTVWTQTITDTLGKAKFWQMCNCCTVRTFSNSFSVKYGASFLPLLTKILYVHVHLYC